MSDIFVNGTGDLTFIKTDLGRASNLLSTQVGNVLYLNNFGIDLEFFLGDEFTFQNETFKAYLISKLSEASINVFEFKDVIKDFFNEYNISLSVNDDTTAFLER